MIIAHLLGYTSAVRDYFEVRPLKVDSLTILKESQDSTVSEVIIFNNQEASQTFTWRLDTGEQNISNTTEISDDIFVFVETNYSEEGVYKTEVSINSTSYSDEETKGVIVQ